MGNFTFGANFRLQHSNSWAANGIFLEPSRTRPSRRHDLHPKKPSPRARRFGIYLDGGVRVVHVTQDESTWGTTRKEGGGAEVVARAGVQAGTRQRASFTVWMAGGPSGWGRRARCGRIGRVLWGVGLRSLIMLRSRWVGRLRLGSLRVRMVTPSGGSGGVGGGEALRIYD